MITPGGRPGDASPLGKKGPRKLDDYTRMVAHALMRQGHSKHRAIAIARSSITKWAAGRQSGSFRGHPRAQVSAAAAASVIHQHILDHNRRK